MGLLLRTRVETHDGIEPNQERIGDIFEVPYDIEGGDVVLPLVRPRRAHPALPVRLGALIHDLRIQRSH